MPNLSNTQRQALPLRMNPAGLGPPGASAGLVLVAASLLFGAVLAAGEDLNTKAIAQITSRPTTAPFTFVLIGDPQGQYETFRRLLAQCAGMKPSFIIVLGDLTRCGEEQDYAAYVESLRAAPAPVLSVIGNHDVPTGGRERYEAMFGKGDRSFDLSGCRFVMLDNADQKLTPDQVSWLDGALAAQGRKFVFMHCPPFLGNWWYDSFTGGTRKFLELADKHKVKRVFMGHLHVVDSLCHEGVDYLICGSGGISPALLPFGQAQVCFVGVTVNPDGEEIAVHPLR